MAEEHKTWFSSRGIDRGRIGPISRRAVREFFGNEFFCSVKLNEHSYASLFWKKTKAEKFSGTPFVKVYCSGVQGRPYSNSADYLWGRHRPSLTAYVVSPSDLKEDEPLDITSIFEAILGECNAWFDLPAVAKDKEWSLLFTLQKGNVQTFRKVS